MTLGKGFYRFLGIVAAFSAIVQSVIWIILSLFGIICYYADCGALPRATAFGRAFNLVYLNTEGTVNSPCIDPIFFHVIMWFYLLLSTVWILISAYLLFCAWKNSRKYKYSGPMWIIFTLFVCASDCMIFIIFTVDFHRSLDTNFHMVYTTSPLERSNFDCVFRRMDEFDDFSGEYTPEERAMIQLSIANEKAKLTEKMKLLARLSETLNTFINANKRNPLVLPPKFTTTPSPQPSIPDVVVNSADLDKDDGLEGPPTHGNLNERLQMCNRRFRRFRTRIGARMMIAPAATMMTLAIRGYIVWLFNVCMALALWRFYVFKQRVSFLRQFSI
ncbi:hypothetical protein CBL_11133 [Carabus blaptoides fortunei]